MNRRSFLRAAPVAGAVIAAPALALAVPSLMTLEELSEYQARQLRDTLEKLHGGAWDFHVNHYTKAAFVICKHA